MAIIEVAERESTKRDPTQSQREAFVARARKQFRLSADAEMKLRENMLDDLKFRASEQWPDEIRMQRQRDGRPCLTINRLPQFIHQVTNQQRENKPAPVVNPVDSDADPLTAEVYQGMIRHIENQSQAQVAYNTAGDHQATFGRGWLRLLTEFEPKSFDQTIRIKRIRNAFTVYPDPACQEVDYSDAEFCFIVTDLTKDEYEHRYGDIEPISADSFASIGDEKSTWMPNDMVRVAEYWYTEYVPDELLDFGAGAILKSEIPPEDLALSPNGAVVSLYGPPDAYGVRQPMPVKRSRKTQERVVKMAVINGVTIIEGNEDRTAGADWPGRWIPIIPVIGDEIDINGTVDLRGIVRDAKGPQQRYNFYVSAETETMALAPRAPFVAAVGQIEGYEKEWETANTRSYSVLPYKPVSEAGHLVGPPQRNSASADVSSMVMGIQQADNDLKAVTGFYDASLGAPGPEQSGKAILARQRQGDIGSYNYQDNMALSISTMGRYLVDLIPKVYDVPRILRIIGEDGKQKAVMVHAGQPPQEPQPEWVEGVYDLSAGTYDVTVSAGPSYQSKRQEFVATATQLVQANPALFQFIGDLLIKNMDWPGAQEIATRLNKMLPPELKDVDENGQPVQAPPPPEMVQQLEQLQGMLEQMKAELDKAQSVISGKQIESQTALQVAQIKSQTDLQIADRQAEVDLAKIQAGLVGNQIAAEARPDVQVATVEAESRERVAEAKSIASLVQTQQKTDAATGLELLKAQLAELTARLDERDRSFGLSDEGE